MRKDGHYINLIHPLEYFERKKYWILDHKKNQHLKEARGPGRPKMMRQWQK
ncbi:3188_t:CDS:2, partial [Scutellospora calospora]